jgi:uncharacterized protein (DUF934 family)
MQKILRLRDAALVDDSCIELVPQTAFLASPDSHTANGKRVGVRVAPADRIEDLAPHLAKVALVAIEFPGPGDGRGFTYARLLRQRYAFTGEVRAVGAGVKQDLLFFMVRCGIDAFDLVAGENLAEARQALHRFTLAYQPAVPNAAIAEPRFTAAR